MKLIINIKLKYFLNIIYIEMLKIKVSKKNLLCIICKKNIRQYKKLICGMCNNPPTINKFLEKLKDIDEIDNGYRRDNIVLYL
jgi:predicted amidophosphoribosyltransferase